jgi:hypothetical protein
MPRTRNWVVRVYDKEGEVCHSWQIPHRAEDEARREAEADIRHIDCDDWVMIAMEAQ